MPPLSHKLKQDRKSTRLNSCHGSSSYAVFCLKKKKMAHQIDGKMEKMAHQFDVMTQQFDEKLETVETRLLTEFHKWAEPVETKQRSHSMALRSLDQVQESLEDRVR